ncbi:hypothetical protein PIB30_072203 [Stylosanthes scabra]|uniref:Uncharacterized protein n=1 Tax=Stylosanthes scabra TaxID=79078 RepID=A0ABU6RP59_9FABA|nr:hypothetical protein [Stylosanthes scabra]
MPKRIEKLKIWIVLRLGWGLGPMEWFITWQLEPKNSGLFDQKPILNSCLNETNELKKKKCKRKLRKQEKRGTEKTKLQEQNRALTPRRHYPCLGVAELASILSPIQHSTPRRNARCLGMNGAARKLALHQGLDA